MSASIPVAVCYVLLLILPAFCSVEDPNLQDVLTALEKMISYYRQTHRDMNLDGIYGLRVLEGQLHVLIREYQEGKHQSIGLPVFYKLQALHDEARNVSRESLPFLQQDDPEYFDLFKPLVDHPMMIAKPYRRIDPSYIWDPKVKAKQPNDFSEEFSDKCMGELMGTERLDGQKCAISAECARAMTARGMGEYQLTHQLLYTELAEECGCSSVLNEWLKTLGITGGMTEMQLEFCTNNFYEVKAQVTQLSGNIIPIYQDLFMEQEFVCPSLGFMEFLHRDWLRQILSWQRPSGCYSHMRRSNLNKAYKGKSDMEYEYDEQNSKDNIVQNKKLGQVDPANQLLQNHLKGGVNQMDQNPVNQQLNRIAAQAKYTDQLAQGVVIQQGGKQGNVLRMHANEVNETMLQRQDDNVVFAGQQQAGESTQQAGYVDQQQEAFHQQQTYFGGQARGRNLQLPDDDFGQKTDSFGQGAGGLRQPDSRLKRNVESLNQHYMEGMAQKDIGLQQNYLRAQQIQNHLLAGDVNMANTRQQVDSYVKNAPVKPKFNGVPDNQQQIVLNNQQFQLSNNRLELNQQGMQPQVDKYVNNRQKDTAAQMPNVVREQFQQKDSNFQNFGAGPDYANQLQGRLNRNQAVDTVGQAGLQQDDNRQWWAEQQQQRKLLGFFHKSNFHINSRQNRHLLVEKRLEGGCLSHKTAVAAGALSQYLRFLIDPGTPSYRFEVQLSGSNMMLIDKSTIKENQLHEGPGQETGNFQRPRYVETRPTAEIVNPAINQNFRKVDLGPGKEEEDEDADDYRKQNMNIKSKDEDGHAVVVGNDQEDYYPHEQPGNLPRDDEDEDRDGLRDLGHQLRNLPGDIGNDDNGNDIFGNAHLRGNREEYDHDDQYIDDNDDAGDQDKIRRRGPALPPLLDNPPVQGFGQDNHANHDEGDYNYYGDRDVRDNSDHTDQDDEESKDYGKLPVSGVLTAGPHLAVRGPPDGLGFTKSVGRTYLVIVAVMVTLLVLMYRFVKKRRVVIKYVYRR